MIVNTFKGKICATHPELQGERSIKKKYCIQCNKDRCLKYATANRQEARDRSSEWRAENPEQFKAQLAKWYLANKEKHHLLGKKWRSLNPEKKREHAIKYRAKHPLYDSQYSLKNSEARTLRAKLWNKAHPVNSLMRVRRRNALKLRAVPSWANEEKMAEFYTTSRMLGMHTGIWHDVDHVVPLKSEYVCGLHCETNLQVIAATENRAKGNRYWPDMPTAT